MEQFYLVTLEPKKYKNFSCSCHVFLQKIKLTLIKLPFHLKILIHKAHSKGMVKEQQVEHHLHNNKCNIISRLYS